MNENVKKISPRLVLTVTDTRTEKKLSLLLQKEHIPMHFQFTGKGTANSELLRICGLGESERILTLWIMPKWSVSRVFTKINRELQLHRRGTGIAVSIPLTGLQGSLARFLNEQTCRELQKLEQEEEKMAEESSYSMILVTVNQGYSDEVLDTAREAGATGGTIVRGRRRNGESPMLLWGVTLQEEQEILAVIVPKAIKSAILCAIREKHGMHSPAHGIILTLPIDEYIGLNNTP